MIAITGHSRGIGQALFERYPGSLGFDLSNGYDIDQDIDRIIQESDHCEVFINNAYCNNRQHDLLQAWYQQHRNHKHVIINISSIVADLNWDLDPRWSFMHDYIQHKRNLNKLSFDINCAGDRCRSITVMPARVDTDFVIPTNLPMDQQQLDKLFGQQNSLHTSDVVNAIDQALASFNSRSFISSISISNL